MSTIAERVAAGAAFLDEHEPGWWRLVDVAALDLSDCAVCVLGQMTGDYDDGLLKFGLDGYDDAHEYGFKENGLFRSQCDYPSLTAEWARVITGRRAATLVRVTREHIARGAIRDCEKCPVALAVIEALGAEFGPESVVHVEQDHIFFWPVPGSEPWLAPTPPAAENFIVAYDGLDERGGPFEFTLTWRIDPPEVTS